MDPHDSNPERRNLSALSLAITAYYWAGGTISGDELRLLVATVHFDRPEILAWMVWAMLLWFLYRYWLHHRGFVAAFFGEVREQSHSMPVFRRLVEPHAQRNVPPEFELKEFRDSFLVRDHNEHRWVIVGEMHCHRPVNGVQQTVQFRVPLTGLKSELALRAAYLRAAILDKSVSSLAAPYVLFWVAVLSALYP